MNQKQGGEGSISERPKDWSAFLASDAVASEAFMKNVEDLPFEERAFFGESANGIEESAFLEGQTDCGKSEKHTSVAKAIVQLNGLYRG